MLPDLSVQTPLGENVNRGEQGCSTEGNEDTEDFQNQILRPLFPSLPSVKILCDASTYLSTEGNEAKEELAFQRNPNSNFVFLPRNSLQKEMKAGLVQQNTIFVFFVIFCLKSSPM